MRNFHGKKILWFRDFFCQIAKFNSHEFQDFLPTAKFNSANFKIFLANRETVYQSSTTKACYLETDSCEMACWFLKSHDDTQKQVIPSDWSAATITNSLKNGETCLEPLDLFADTDPLVSEPSVEQDDSNILQINKGLIQHLSSGDIKDSCNSH